MVEVGGRRRAGPGGVSGMKENGPSGPMLLPIGTSKNYQFDEAADRKPAQDRSFSHAHGTDGEHHAQSK